MKNRLLTTLLGAALALPICAWADPLLTVTSTIADGTTITQEFSAEELLALEQVEVLTANDYVEGDVSFSGPLLRSVFPDGTLDPSDTIKLTALNNYSTEMPASEALDYNVILAMSQNGVRMSVRDKGPLWVIYPMNDHKELREPLFNDRLVWQLSKMEHLPSH
ncbi:putative pterin-binding protein [Actibacterium sp. D379-3]